MSLIKADYIKFDRLIIDIGRYSISYTVLTPTNEVLYFKVDSFMVDIDNIFDEPTTKFIERVSVTARDIKVDFPSIKNTIILIPTKDLLLVENKKITLEGLQKILENDYQVSDDSGLVKSISRPYKIGEKYFTPVSFYDENINILINEIDMTGDKNKDRARSNVIFQTAIYRMISLASRTKGRTAIIDSSFTSTKVLLVKDGSPIEYMEFDLSGENMLKYVYSKSKGVPIEEILKIINSYEDSVANSVPEALLAQEYLRSEAELEIIPFLKKVGIDNILFIGGLSHTDFLNKLNVPIEKLNSLYGLTKDIEEIPEPLEYKLQMALGTPIHGGILDRDNIDILTGVRNINDFNLQGTDDFSEEDLLLTEEIVGDSTELNNDMYVNISKSIKDNYQIEGLLKESNDDESDSGGLTVINLESDAEEEKKEVKKVQIKSITPEQEDMLDFLEKSYKKPGRYETKMPVLVTGILAAVVLVGLMIGLNVSGSINVKSFRLLGISQPEDIVVQKDYGKSILDKIKHVIREREINYSTVNLGIQTIGNNINLNNVRVNKQTDFKHNVGFYLTQNLKNIMNDNMDMKIDIDSESSTVDNIYKIYVQFDLDPTSKRAGQRGNFEITGDDKWALEEDRLFFDANDYTDFIEGKRNVGDPTRKERETTNQPVELQQNNQDTK